MSAAFGPIGVTAETERLVIRPWQLDEADRYLDLYRQPEVIRWFPSGPTPTRQQAVQRVERNLAEIAHDPRFGRWAVVDRATGAQAWTIILKPLPDGDGEVEIAWHFHPDSWGRGLASEAAVAVLARGFEQGLNEGWALTDPFNRRSIAVCRRIGMRLLVNKLGEVRARGVGRDARRVQPTGSEVDTRLRGNPRRDALVRGG